MGKELDQGENKVSIIIPTYNRMTLVCQCLESLQGLSYHHYEVLVIDDASDDQTADLLQARFKDITIIRNSKRRGPAYCKNQGILKSRGQYLWFLDSDSVIVDKECLGAMVQLLQQDQKIGCIGGEMVEEGGKNLLRIDGYTLSEKVPIDENSKYGFTMRKVRSLMTCNLCTRKELLMQVGGFDNNYFYISEDTDICVRIHALGYDIILDYRTLVLHRYSRVARKSNYYLLFRNEIRSAVKNEGMAKGLLSEPGRMFGNIIRASRKKTIKDAPGSIHNTPLGAGKGSIYWRLGWLAINIMTAFLFAYGWNLLMLYKTLCIDKKINYLKITAL